MVAPRAVAIIPARGGSKRIERKNVVDFCGKPMIAWTIEAARQTDRFAFVVVSTEDPEIAELARHFGALVPFLRREYSDDHSPVSLATIGTLVQLRDELGEEFETVVQLTANCPLRNEHHIVAALDHFLARGASSQLSCSEFGWTNPWWAATLSEDGRPNHLFPERLGVRSQDLPSLYCPTGAIWIATARHLLQHQTYLTPDRIYWPMPWRAAVDIDNWEDLRLAELLYAMGAHGEQVA
jgi:N-acylneuraminate cytidylyltransferase